MSNTQGKLDESKKILVLTSRAAGLSFDEIGENVGVSKEGVRKFLKTLPHSEEFSTKNEYPMPNLSDTEKSLLHLALARTKNGTKIEAETGIPLSEIQAYCDYLTGRGLIRGVKISGEYYPAIKRWMTKEGCSEKELAEKLGITAQNFRKIMTGYARLSANKAKKIKEITGLTYKEMFSNFEQGWREMLGR